MCVFEWRFSMAYCLKWMFWIILVTYIDGFIRQFSIKSLHYFILFKHLTNNYETRSVWFSHEEILSCNPSIHIKRVYRPETHAHGQCQFMEKLMMGNFTTRFLKSLCALVFREESGKPSYLQGQKKHCKHGKWSLTLLCKKSCKCIKTKKPNDGERPFLQEWHRQPRHKRQRSQLLQNDSTLQ